MRTHWPRSTSTAGEDGFRETYIDLYFQSRLALLVTDIAVPEDNGLTPERTRSGLDSDALSMAISRHDPAGMADMGVTSSRLRAVVRKYIYTLPFPRDEAFIIHTSISKQPPPRTAPSTNSPLHSHSL